MIAEYTMFYNDYMTAYGAPKNLALIPSITIGGKTYSFANMFNDRYRYREICAESTTYFTHLANRVLQEAAILFTDKINSFEANKDKLWVKEVKEDESSYSNYYLNPTVSAKDGDPKLQSTSENINPHHIYYNSGNMSEMIEAANAIEHIFYECLTYCDKLFIALY